MNSRSILSNLPSCLIAVLCCGPPTDLLIAAERPNVIVILTDDQGWGDLSVHGNTNLSTPNVDSLARAGARFERFLVCPVCSPTRAEFLTGRYHPRTGVRGVTRGGERLNLDEVTIAEMFRRAGYSTGGFGKWHNGTQYPYHPNGRGFDEFYGFTSGHWGHYFSPPLDHNGRLVRGNGYLTDDFTDRAIDFIEQHRDEPFFAYVAYNTPHSPMQVPDRWWNKLEDKTLALRGTQSKLENLDHTRAALAMCENIDWNVGRLLHKLDELDLADNTIVVYFCDNGPNGHRWNGGLAGIKGTTDEGGVRSPLFIRWPRLIPAGTRVTQLAGAIDLLPTLTDLAGIEQTNEKPLDGVSLKSFIVGSDVATTVDSSVQGIQNRVILSQWSDNVSAATGRYRLTNAGELHDVRDDPGQDHDLSQLHPEIKKRLDRAVANWKNEVLANLDRDDRPFVVGHGDWKATQLPARDAEASGGIRRSSRHPNCSFFTNWMSTDDRIAWDVEVLTPGDYQAVVYYTCQASDVGSMVELSFGDERVRAEINDAHDPPLQGGEHDRVERQESYVKDFRPLELGTIRLERGRGQLVMQAVQIPGSKAMDFRLLVLTRVDH